MTKIKSPNYTSWGNSNESVRQPNGVNYDQLLDKLSEKKEPQVKDLRKPISKKSKSHTNVDESVQKLDKGSVIPVPGLMVQHENSESDWQPSSEWHTPQGVQWGQ